MSYSTTGHLADILFVPYRISAPPRLAADEVNAAGAFLTTYEVQLGDSCRQFGPFVTLVKPMT